MKRLKQKLVCLVVLIWCYLIEANNIRHENDGRTARSHPSPSPPRNFFLQWAERTLGVSTHLEIQTFEYLDYMGALLGNATADELPTIKVRGLAATRDIAEGEILIRIPVQALLSVATTIDEDPVLNPVLGPSARKANGWEANKELFPDSAYLEIPLLAIALLHHQSLGSSSALYPYVQILEDTPLNSIPYLWNSSRMEELPPGIRTVAESTQEEIKELYTLIVGKLIEFHPKLFGEPENGEWFYSFEKFQKAYALVNSRHWQLPVTDLEKTRPPSSVDDIPPASTPTDAWVSDHDGDSDSDASHVHSFLAPVADLINFGPACTRSRYNKEDHVFELIAACPYMKGQEVTFYYSDECDEVMVGLYGFSHPMIPACPTTEEYRQQVDDWRQRAEDLEKRLKEAYKHLDQAESDLHRLHEILGQCDCCRYEDKVFPRVPRPPAGSETTSPERHNVRASYRNSRSRTLEF